MTLRTTERPFRGSRCQIPDATSSSATRAPVSPLDSHGPSLPRPLPRAGGAPRCQPCPFPWGLSSWQHDPLPFTSCLVPMNTYRATRAGTEGPAQPAGHLHQVFAIFPTQPTLKPSPSASCTAPALSSLVLLNFQSFDFKPESHLWLSLLCCPLPHAVSVQVPDTLFLQHLVVLPFLFPVSWHCCLITSLLHILLNIICSLSTDQTQCVLFSAFRLTFWKGASPRTVLCSEQAAERHWRYENLAPKPCTAGCGFSLFLDVTQDSPYILSVQLYALSFPEHSWCFLFSISWCSCL